VPGDKLSAKCKKGAFPCVAENWTFLQNECAMKKSNVEILGESPSEYQSSRIHS